MVKNSLKFHIENDDYFGTLATILSLISQSIQKQDFDLSIKTLNLLEEDLKYLQDNYKIICRNTD